MSIEQKIAEILAESKEKAVEDHAEMIEQEEVTESADQAEVVSEEVVAEEEVAEEQQIEQEQEEAIAEDSKLDIKDDVNALVEGEELTEEFKQKAATIFEAAVMSRVKQEVAKLDEAYEVKLAEQVEQIKEGLVEKVDGYLNYVVEQWMEQNEIALESGMKSEILEGFVGGLKSLFEEHYIDIPEEKFDVLGSLEEHAEDLRTKLDEEVSTNVELNKQLAAYQVKEIVADASEGLTDTDKEKFKSLVEELAFDGVDSFKKKVQTLRESYFTNKATTKSKPVVDSVFSDEPVSLTEEKEIPAHMKRYMSVLDSLK